jgi:hypothetical protein
MPKTVYVEFSTDAAEIDFGPSSALFQYTNSINANHQLSSIKDRLTHYLKKNNVKSKEGHEPEYTIKITDLILSEEIITDTYMDTCEFPTLERTLTKSKLHYTVKVDLFNRGNTSLLHQISRGRTKEESVPECSCGEIEAGAISVSNVVDDISKELRKDLADAIYIDKGF